MLKHLCVYFYVASAVQMTSAFGANGPAFSQPMVCDGLERLKSCMMTMQTVPGIRKLMAEIEKEGPVHITVDDRPLSQQFGAFWDAERRVICVNISWHRSNGAVIGSILFEMHNALADAKFKELDQLASMGQIDRETYVKEMERVEFDNSHAAAALAQQGIDQGAFPKDARLPTYPSFEEHYRMQQIGGHCYWIARNYDQVAPRAVRRR